MSDLLYISDYFASQIVGGGELNDDELLNQLLSRGINVRKLNSSNVRESDIQDNVKIVISNFVNLRKNVFEKIIRKSDYIIYEHDHKYLKNRNPAAFPEFKAPKDFIVNEGFYRNAVKVLCQSSFHKNIIKKNLGINNLYNISGNLWSDGSLSLMTNLLNNKKEDCFSIMDSKIAHKNTSECVSYCKLKNFNFQLVSSQNYLDFLSMLSKNEKFLFLPKTPETLSRVVVEAKMMGVKVITNKNVGAAHEPWFDKNGLELIDFMSEKRQEVVVKILEFLNE